MEAIAGENDNGKDVGGVCVMYSHKSAKAAQAGFARTNLAKPACKNKGPDKGGSVLFHGASRKSRAKTQKVDF